MTGFNIMFPSSDASPPLFEPFNKIPRLRREITITEKIDGTNALIHITNQGDLFVGSRTRWIRPGKDTDNYGFASWVEGNRQELLKLGPGRHFGEWWGQGIQRGYGLTGKRFSLFNTDKWTSETLKPLGGLVGVVPVLYKGPFSEKELNTALWNLRDFGSYTPEAQGFSIPEGVVVYMRASGSMHKVLLENDDLPKGIVPKAEREEAARRATPAAEFFGSQEA